MAQDTYGRYTGTGRPIDDMGETTPEVEVSESIRPWGKFLPAPYLPVTRFDVHKRANIVLSVGTPVGFDKQGYLVPAGIPDGHAFQYDSEDYRTGMGATLNPATGAAISSSDTYAIMHQDLVGTSGQVAGAAGNDFVRPVGVTSYNVFSHEGGVSFTTWPDYSLTYSNPVNFQQHNSMAQDLVAITCDYCLLVPYVEGKNLLGPEVKVFDADSDLVDELSKKAKSYVFAHDELKASNQFASSGLRLTFVSPALGTGDDGAATPGGGTGLDASTPSAVLFAGSNGTVESSVDCSTPGSYTLRSALAPHEYVVLENTMGMHAVGISGALTTELEAPICPGDFVVARIGKFVKYNQYRHNPDEIAGQVLAVDKNVTDKSYLSRVKSAYERASVAGDMMPGSATRGVPFNLHMVTDGAWRQYSTSMKLDGTPLVNSTTPALRLLTINLLK
jgi:hypothetical protein